MNRARRIATYSLSTVLILCGLLLYDIAPVVATTPVTISTTNSSTSTNSTQQSLLCLSNNYYYAVFIDSSGNLVYSSSADGATWAANTQIDTSANIFGAGGQSIYCDSSNNLYLAYMAHSGTAFDTRYGTTSGGVITWTAAALSLSCTSVGTRCNPTKIIAYSTSNIWVGVYDQANGIEIWTCQTSACTTSGHWSDNKQVAGPTQVDMVAGSSTSTVIVGYSSGSGTAINMIDTVNSGGAWTAAKTTANTYIQPQGQCVGISTTIYCAEQNSANSEVYLIQIAAGGASWTETAINTGIVVGSIGTTLSTDGTNILITWQKNGVATELDYVATIPATLTGLTVNSFVTGESNIVGGLTATPTLQTTNSVGVMWTAGTANPWNVRFAFTLAPVVTVTITSTVTAIAVTACTAFELGCWLYPVFTIMMVAAVVIGEARFIQVPKGDYTGLFLEASAMGGLICVLFGILNVMVPIIILLMQIVRAIAK